MVGFAVRPAVLAAGLWLLAGPPAAPGGADPDQVRRLSCGPYEAVPSGLDSSGAPTRLTIQKDGRLLVAVSDWRVTGVTCRAIDPGHSPVLFVTTFSGGAHCCETLRAWALEASPRLLLVFGAGDATGFDLRDLDGSGRLELLLGDDTFAFFDNLCATCAPSRLPLVACLADGRFTDCTRHFPDLLRDAMTPYLARLARPISDEQTAEVEGAALGILALSVVLGDEGRGLDAIRAAAPGDAVLAWLDRARPQVRDWAAARGRKLQDGKECGR
jgi:hypothetical protein